MKIPYSLPLIDQSVVDEVNDTLLNTGWLTSGPKVVRLENELCSLTSAPKVICVNSWVSGAMLMMRWFGVGAGDEVLIPAYTYSATALAVMNMGAIPVMVDVCDDFCINVENIKSKITARTKIIIPVDIAGWPCNYDGIMAIANDPAVRQLFTPASPKQEKLGRPLVIADAAHSIGARYKNRPSAVASDIAIFSFHSVKNITTGEGGAVCLNLPEPFDNNEEYSFLKHLSINGQTKSAFEKNKAGGWRYDIIDQGLKVNMPDICASIGLAQIRKYDAELLPERKRLFELYNSLLNEQWAILPPFDNNEKQGSYHLYLLRLKGLTEEQRDQVIQLVSEKEVGVNVHYIPMPMLTLFKNRGYQINDYPKTYSLYANEISLPLYNGLTSEQVERVVATVKEAYITVTSANEKI